MKNHQLQILVVVFAAVLSLPAATRAAIFIDNATLSNTTPTVPGPSWTDNAYANAYAGNLLYAVGDAGAGYTDQTYTSPALALCRCTTS